MGIGKSRLKQTGLYVSNPEHWETWDSKIHIYKQVRQQKYKISTGEIRSCLVKIIHGRILIPVNLIRHLKLEHGDKIQIAIRKVIEQ